MICHPFVVIGPKPATSERPNPVSHLSDPDLMLLADGELADAGAARRSLGGDDVRKIEGIKQVGDLVRGHLELAADEAEPRLAGLWDLVERRLPADDGPPVSVPPAAPGWAARVFLWLRQYRGHFATGALSAGAVAIVALMMRSPTVVVQTVEAPHRAAPVPLVPVRQPMAPEIESLEVSGGTGMVFTIEDDDGGSDTAVIWITPDDVVEGL